MKQNVFFIGKDIAEVREEDILSLKESAMASPMKRARLCAHKSHDDAIHEMIIAFCKGSYVRPHRHRAKTESFHIIDGELLVVFFDDGGKVTYWIKMAAHGSGRPFFYRLSKSAWHMAIPLSEYVIMHEVTNGPFIEKQSEFSSWSPEESNADEVKVFLSKVLKATAV